MSEYELDDRGHRRAVLHRQPACGEQFGVILGRGLRCEREVIGAADGGVERAAAAVFGGIGGVGEFARRGEPIVKPGFGGQRGDDHLGHFNSSGDGGGANGFEGRFEGGHKSRLEGRIEFGIGAGIMGQFGRIDRLLGRCLDIIGKAGEAVAAVVLALVLVIFLAVIVERIGREIGPRGAVVIAALVERRDIAEGLVERGIGGEGGGGEFLVGLVRGRIRPVGQRVGGAHRGLLGQFQLFAHFKRLIDFEQQFVGGQLVGHLLPVDHAVDEVYRLVVARIGQQNAAVEDFCPALVDEFGLEPDRRLIGDDLHVVIGDAAQQRARRHVRQAGDGVRTAAFECQLCANELHNRILDPGGEVEQHAVGAEIGAAGRIEIVDQREHPVTELSSPVIIGAHLHTALVLADGFGRQIGGGCSFGAGILGGFPAVIRRQTGRIGRFARIEWAAQSVHGYLSAPW